MLDARPGDAEALYLLAQMRRVQKRFTEAEDLYRRSLAIDAQRCEVHYHFGQLLRAAGKYTEALAAFEEAIRLQSNFVQAHLDRGLTLADLGEFRAAEKAYRTVLRFQPNDLAAKQALSAALIQLGRAAEAERCAREALARQPRDPLRAAALSHNLAIALSGQHKHEEALRAFDRADRLKPQLPQADYNRANTLQSMGRLAEAEAAYRRALVRDPLDLKAHRALNELLFRLDRPDFLRSYDESIARFPNHPELSVEKGRYLLMSDRHAEACDTFARALRSVPDDLAASDGYASALARIGRLDDAVAQYEQLLRRPMVPVETHCHYVECLLRAGDGTRGLRASETALTIAPHDQLALALWGTALRQLGDSREEVLNDYAKFVQVFDLEPPPEISDMESFNTALNACLDRLHVDQHAHVNQTSRFGTQTLGTLFGAGHEVIELLKLRLDDAVAAYIANLPENPSHPLLGRRGRGFGYSGSWSTRLHDCGFHTNHVHPKGWISSAYYVALPDVVGDDAGRQGWLQFGEPSFDAHLVHPVRLCVQPRHGRLVLFPSYVWHGTVPFRAQQTRTTIAFDVAPTSWDGGP